MDDATHIDNFVLLSTRAKNCLRDAGILTVGDVREFLRNPHKIANFGRKTWHELAELVGMRLPCPPMYTPKRPKERGPPGSSVYLTVYELAALLALPVDDAVAEKLRAALRRC